MSQKEIYLVRHGETDFNLKGIVQGRGVDSELNYTGLKQAEAFYNYYKNIAFDQIFVSTLKRTKQTIDHFVKSGIPMEELSSLDEINWGIYEGVELQPEMYDSYLGIIDLWKNGSLDIKIEGGESANDLMERQQPFIDLIQSMDFRRLLVCSHGRSIRALLCTLTRKSLENMDDFPHTNTSLYKIIYNEGRFEIDLFNNTDHLIEFV